MFQGTGVYKSPSKDIYKGMWVKDKPHGQGKIKFADGEVYSGLFENGEMTGAATLTGDNGAKIEGQWDGRQDGKPFNLNLLTPK